MHAELWLIPLCQPISPGKSYPIRVPLFLDWYHIAQRCPASRNFIVTYIQRVRCVRWNRLRCHSWPIFYSILRHLLLKFRRFCSTVSFSGACPVEIDQLYREVGKFRDERSLWKLFSPSSVIRNFLETTIMRNCGVYTLHKVDSMAEALFDARRYKFHESQLPSRFVPSRLTHPIISINYSLTLSHSFVLQN